MTALTDHQFLCLPRYATKSICARIKWNSILYTEGTFAVQLVILTSTSRRSLYEEEEDLQSRILSHSSSTKIIAHTSTHKSWLPKVVYLKITVICSCHNTLYTSVSMRILLSCCYMTRVSKSTLADCAS